MLRKNKPVFCYVDCFFFLNLLNFVTNDHIVSRSFWLSVVFILVYVDDDIKFDTNLNDRLLPEFCH